jgi:hypothetical protein
VGNSKVVTGAYLVGTGAKLTVMIVAIIAGRATVFAAAAAIPIGILAMGITSGV